MARYLDNWFDAAIIRCPELDDLKCFADAATMPTVNARTRQNHPCEILGDLAFVKSQGKDFDGLHLVFVGEATNLLHSWCEAAEVLPIQITQVCPSQYRVRQDVEDRISQGAGSLSFTGDLVDAVRTADVIYTDCWPSSESDSDAAAIRAAFAPFQITAAVLESAKLGTMFLPCPPVSRGNEVSVDAMEATQCRVYEAKGWLLEAQLALLNALCKR